MKIAREGSTIYNRHRRRIFFKRFEEENVLGSSLMDISLKDVVVLLAGGLLGLLASVVAALATGPIITAFGNFYVIRALGAIRAWFRESEFDGQWKQEWHVASEQFRPANVSELRLFALWDHVAGEFEVVSPNNTKRRFRLFARFRDDRLTGLWQDTTRAGYYGAFQVARSPAGGPFVGVWCGYSHTTSTIKSGQWTFTKVA